MSLRIQQHAGQLRKSKNKSSKLFPYLKWLWIIPTALWFMWLLSASHQGSVVQDHSKGNYISLHTASLGSPNKGERATNTAYDTSRLCTQNPYNRMLKDPLDAVATRIDQFLSTMDQQYQKALDPTTKRGHRRFFPFESRAPCSSVSCVGGECRVDTSKIMCGADELREGCVIYSIGGNNQWEFEQDLLVKTPCEIHTFDCTGHVSRFEKPDNDRLHFHHVCLGSESQPANMDVNCTKKCGETWTLLEMQRSLKHKRIDLLKIDIEGFEWGLFESWPLLSDQRSSEEVLLPMQLLLELHYRTKFIELVDENTTGKYPVYEFKNPSQTVAFAAHLMKMGYAVQVQDNNAQCKHCTELTFTRFRCPGGGAYAGQL